MRTVRNGFSGDEDYILKLTTMLFEEMFQR